MKKWLMDHLVCPNTQEALTLYVTRREGEEILEGTLKAPSSSTHYPIISGVPRFVATHYAQNFALEWQEHKRTQFDNLNHHHSHQRFFGETAFHEKRLRNMLVLDVGCGAGRFTEVAASLGGKVIAMDISEAVDAAFNNFSHMPNVAIVQADIYSMPFRKGSFDFVFSLGVIQHTPDPLQAVSCIAEMAKANGGELGISWYQKQWYTYLHQKYLLRLLFRHWKPETLYRFIRWYTPKVLPLSRWFVRLPLFNVLNLNRYNLADRILPVANRDFVEGLTQEERIDWAILDTFDWYSPRYDKPQTLHAIESTLLKAGYCTQKSPNQKGLYGKRW